MFSNLTLFSIPAPHIKTLCLLKMVLYFMIAYKSFTFLIQYLTDQAKWIAQERKNGKIKQNLQKRL